MLKSCNRNANNFSVAFADFTLQEHHINWIKLQLLNLGDVVLSEGCQAWAIYYEMSDNVGPSIAEGRKVPGGVF